MACKRLVMCTHESVFKGCEYMMILLLLHIGMSVDGDLQGIPRIIGALSAHMWPGLVMKPAEKHSNVQPVSEENDGGTVNFVMCTAGKFLFYIFCREYFKSYVLSVCQMHTLCKTPLLIMCSFLSACRLLK